MSEDAEQAGASTNRGSPRLLAGDSSRSDTAHVGAVHTWLLKNNQLGQLKKWQGRARSKVDPKHTESGPKLVSESFSSKPGASESTPSASSAQSKPKRPSLVSRLPGMRRGNSGKKAGALLSDTPVLSSDPSSSNGNVGGSDGSHAMAPSAAMVHDVHRAGSRGRHDADVPTGHALDEEHHTRADDVPVWAAPLPVPQCPLCNNMTVVGYVLGGLCYHCLASSQGGAAERMAAFVDPRRLVSARLDAELQKLSIPQCTLCRGLTLVSNSVGECYHCDKVWRQHIQPRLMPSGDESDGISSPILDELPASDEETDNFEYDLSEHSLPKAREVSLPMGMPVGEKAAGTFSTSRKHLFAGGI